MRFIDTHCHIHFNAFKDDMDDAIKRSLAKGIFMITVGTQSTTSKRGLEVAEKYEGVWATVGVHPGHSFAHEFVDAAELDVGQTIKARAEVVDIDYYRALGKHPKCVAIGECGLAYFRLPEGKEEEVKATQQTAFRAQLDLADELGLPIVLHSREAHEDTMKILREYLSAGRLKRCGVAHCFVGTLPQAQDLIKIGFMISVTGIVAFLARKKEADAEGRSPLQNVVREIPLASLMLETDSPYLAPPPHRGKRGEPWMVEIVAETIAQLKRVNVEEIARVTNENAQRFFQLN